MRRFLMLVLGLGLFLAACQSGNATIPPTAFPTAAPTLTLQSQTPVALTLTELAAAPGLYLDVPLQVTGLFKKQPVLVCDADPHPSPATWALTEAGVVTQASGFDQEVRSLLPDGLAMTVEGRWRRWQGLVGCGKSAQPQEIWYLDVSKIISPSPVVQVTLTPGGGTDIAQLPETLAPEIATPELEATPTVEEGLPLPEATIPGGSYPIDPTQPSDPFQPTDEPFPATPDDLTTPTPPGAATATPTGTAGTGTPTATQTPGGPTATASPTATTQAGNLQTVDQGDIFDIDEEFASETIAAGTAHRWTIELFEDETFTVSAIAAAPADIVLSVLKDGTAIVDKQNTAPTGQAETISAPSLNGEGIYEIIVQTAGGAAAEYAIVAYIEGDFEVEFKGFLNSGAPQSNINMAADATHYWFFTAGAGNRLSAVLTPDADSDIVGDFFGPGAEFLDITDEGIEGEAESLSDFPVPNAGLHAVRVSEIDYAGMTYTIVVTLQ